MQVLLLKFLSVFLGSSIGICSCEHQMGERISVFTFLNNHCALDLERQTQDRTFLSHLMSRAAFSSSCRDPAAGYKAITSR